MTRTGRPIIYPDNDNSVILPGLKHAISGDYIITGTVTFTLKNWNGEDVSGAVGVALAYTDPEDIDAELLADLAPDGNWIGVLEDGVSLTPGAKYTMHIHADAGSDQIGDWEIHPIVRRRTS